MELPIQINNKELNACTLNHALRSMQLKRGKSKLIVFVQKKSCPSVFPPIRTKNDQSKASIVPDETK